MDEEKHILHNWEGKQIYVKEKTHVVPQLVNETILNLRRHLVTLKINDLAKSIKEVNNDDEKKELLLETIDYTILKKVLSDKLNRVL
jgi:DNA primase